MALPLQSRRYEVPDPIEAIEFCYQKGWTDGLPVVPPTEGRIRAMLDAAGLSPETVLGELQARRRIVTAEKVAINAVMAGCLPAYMPVVATAVQAMTDPAFSLHGPVASTSGMGLLVIVNGPVARALQINGGENLFGPGNRANATIGRAIRLILMNCFGATPGLLDRSAFGHPGKYSYCIAENEPVSPWTPLHVERGCPPGSSAVTVMAGESPHQVVNQTARTPEAILATVADVLAAAGRMNVTGQGEYAVLIGQEHMRLIAAAGWGKPEIRQFLFAHARRSVAELKRAARLPGPPQPGDEEKRLGIVEQPDHLLIVAAGGATGGYSATIAGWVGRGHSRAVTKQIQTP
ncbi:MAG: hypothetical protein HYV08_15210 [Deltaproteobacteria bacterium]|nr:hypothetical protein [Deltaproteobacteria bacterium]